jgi:hypothetical protein
MKIKWTTLYVDTEALGFHKKADFSQDNYRWLTVPSPQDPDGVELVLEANANPPAKAFQEARFG